MHARPIADSDIRKKLRGWLERMEESNAYEGFDQLGSGSGHSPRTRGRKRRLRPSVLSKPDLLCALKTGLSARAIVVSIGAEI